MPGTYNAGDLINKSLFAAKQVPLYHFPGDSYTPYAYVDPPNLVGQVYSWVYQGADLWWQFYPVSSSGGYYYTKHGEGVFDVNALRQQGVYTQEEQARMQAEKNKPWYEQLIDKYGPWILGGALAAAAIKGYLGRPRPAATQ